MISLENVQTTSTSVEPISSPRVSFSADLFDDEDFITINPHSLADNDHEKLSEKVSNVEFEFFSSDSQTMLSADELLFDGKLLPFLQTQQSEKLKNISLKTEHSVATKAEVVNKVESSSRVTWLLDDDPSPRPPTCTVLWKELLRLRKQRSSTLSLSSSSSSSSLRSLDLPPIEEGKEGTGIKDKKHVKRIKKGLERTRSASIRIRPVVNVPICTQGKSSNALPPLFSFRKAKLEK